MKLDNYQICKRCVMDTSDIQISFDEKGYCNHCSEYIKKRIFFKFQGDKSKEEFDRIIQQIKEKGKNKKYDCIIGISGGVDSSYVVYLAKKNGLRVLCVHLDNGWNSEEAVLNIKNIAKKLEVDYESYVLNWSEFKDLQKSFLLASVPEAETPTDIAIPGALHKIAAKYGVKYVISGGNIATEGILPKTWHYNAKDFKYFNYIHKKFGSKKLKHFPHFHFLKEMYYKFFKGIRIVYLLNFIDYNKEKASELLKKEIDWKSYGGKHHESKYTSFIQSYYLYKKFNIDYRRATFSSLICINEFDRNEALEILKTIPYNSDKIEEDKKYIAKKLDFEIEKLEQIINDTPKWYFDYPNNEKRLSFIYNLYRRIFKKEKLANF